MHLRQEPLSCRGLLRPVALEASSCRPRVLGFFEALLPAAFSLAGPSSKGWRSSEPWLPAYPAALPGTSQLAARPCFCSLTSRTLNPLRCCYPRLGASASPSSYFSKRTGLRNWTRPSCFLSQSARHRSSNRHWTSGTTMRMKRKRNEKKQPCLCGFCRLVAVLRAQCRYACSCRRHLWQCRREARR